MPPSRKERSTNSPPTDEQLVGWYQAGELPDQISGYFGLKGLEPFRAVGRQAAALHNAGRLDLISLIESGAVAVITGHKFFTIQTFMIEALPHVDAPVARMLAAVESLVKQGGDDGASTWPNAALREWLRKDLGRAEEVIGGATAGDPSAGSNLTFALEALADPARARGFLASSEMPLRTSGATALGRMPDPDPESRAASLRDLAVALGNGGNDMLCANVLQAALSIAEQGDLPSPEAMMNAVSLSLKTRSDGALNRAAHALWAIPAARGDQPLPVLLEALLDLNPTGRS